MGVVREKDCKTRYWKKMQKKQIFKDFGVLKIIFSIITESQMYITIQSATMTKKWSLKQGFTSGSSI